MRAHVCGHVCMSSRAKRLTNLMYVINLSFWSWPCFRVMIFSVSFPLSHLVNSTLYNDGTGSQNDIFRFRYDRAPCLPRVVAAKDYSDGSAGEGRSSVLYARMWGMLVREVAGLILSCCHDRARLTSPKILDRKKWAEICERMLVHVHIGTQLAARVHLISLLHMCAILQQHLRKLPTFSGCAKVRRKKYQENRDTPGERSDRSLVGKLACAGAKDIEALYSARPTAIRRTFKCPHALL